MSKFAIQGGLPANYVLGRGRLFLRGERGKTNAANELQGDTEYWRDIGNVTQMAVTQENETKDHTDYQTGIQNIDKSIAVSTKMNISFATDELSANNLANFFGGTILSGLNGGTQINAARIDSDDGTVFSGVQNMWFEVPALAGAHFTDLWIDLEMTVAVSVGGVLGGQKISARNFEAAGVQTITVRKNPTNRTAADGTLLTEGTHYVLDRVSGAIRFLAGSVTGGDDIQIKWNDGSLGGAGVGTDLELHTFTLLEHTGKTVAIKFVQENPNDDNKIAVLEFWQVKLKPEGEYAGIGDDWAQVAFSGVAETLSSGVIPYGGNAIGRFTLIDSVKSA